MRVGSRQQAGGRLRNSTAGNSQCHGKEKAGISHGKRNRIILAHENVQAAASGPIQAAEIQAVMVDTGGNDVVQASIIQTHLWRQAKKSGGRSRPEACFSTTNCAVNAQFDSGRPAGRTRCPGSQANAAAQHADAQHDFELEPLLW